MREHPRLAPLRAIRLHDANAGEVLVEPAGDQRVQLRAFLEDRPDRLEREEEDRHEDDHHHRDDRRELRAEVEEDADRDSRRDQPAEELHQAGADEVANPLGVVHHARHEDAGLGRVEVVDRESLHVLLQLHAQLGDRPLRGDAEDLRQRVVGDRGDDRRRGGGHDDLPEQVVLMLDDDVVDQPLRRRREQKARQPVDQHEREAEEQPESRAPDNVAGVAHQRAHAGRFRVGHPRDFTGSNSLEHLLFWRACLYAHRTC